VVWRTPGGRPYRQKQKLFWQTDSVVWQLTRHSNVHSVALPHGSGTGSAHVGPPVEEVVLEDEAATLVDEELAATLVEELLAATLVEELLAATLATAVSGAPPPDVELTAGAPPIPPVVLPGTPPVPAGIPPLPVGAPLVVPGAAPVPADGPPVLVGAPPRVASPPTPPPPVPRLTAPPWAQLAAQSAARAGIATRAGCFIGVPGLSQGSPRIGNPPESAAAPCPRPRRPQEAPERG
jgi:hypothetical protein